MRMQVPSLPSLIRLRIQPCCKLQQGSQMRLRFGMAVVWHNLAATARIQPLAWELPYAAGVTLKKKKSFIFSFFIILFEFHLVHKFANLKEKQWEVIFLTKAFFFNSFLIFNFFFLFMATPGAYGSSQARDQIWAAAARLHNSNTKPKLCLWPSLQLRQCWILNPLSKARDRTCILMDPS